MALTVLRDPAFSSILQLASFPDEFSALFDAPSARFAKETQAIANTAVDVKETPDAFVFHADLPGLKKDEVKVQIEDGNVLTITGERTREAKQENERFHRMERSTGKFLRRFRLPENAKVESITAAAKDGVLTVTVPKVPPPEPKKPTVVSVNVQ